MASIKWHKTASVETIFQTEPYTFDFDQAIFILERLQAYTQTPLKGYTFDCVGACDFSRAILKK